jgi:hypothetical protein
MAEGARLPADRAGLYCPRAKSLQRLVPEGVRIAFASVGKLNDAFAALDVAHQPNRNCGAGIAGTSSRDDRAIGRLSERQFRSTARRASPRA